MTTITRVVAHGLCLVAAASSCSELTTVESPDLIHPDAYNTPAGASNFAAGAVTRFNLAFGGAPTNFAIGQNQVALSAQFADELWATSASQSLLAWDSRDPLEPAPIAAEYTNLQVARVNLLNAIRTFQRVAPDSGARIGQLFALAGFIETFFGENFCSGVPLGGFDAELRPVYGQPLSTQQLLEAAVQHFDSAITYAVDSTRVLNLARIGKGRALLNLARYAEASQAVTAVPTAYIYNAVFIAGVQHNGLFGLGSQNRFTIPEREGANGLNWRTANDPRVQLVNRSPALLGVDRVTQVWA